MAENVDKYILSGAGDAEVFASVKLDVKVLVVQGDVKYKGNASGK